MGLGSSTLWLCSSILWTFLGSQLLSSPLCWSIWQVSLSSYVRGNFYADSLSTFSASKLMGQDLSIKGQFVGVNCGQCVVVKVLSVRSWSLYVFWSKMLLDDEVNKKVRALRCLKAGVGFIGIAHLTSWQPLRRIPWSVHAIWLFVPLWLYFNHV
jgi:hypothetical protein